MAPIFTVVGATGAQGGSVVDAALKSGLYSVRAITRDISSSKAKALEARGVEVVAADADNEESLIKAFEGSTAIYGLTDFIALFMKHGPEEAIRIEVQQGTNLARAAGKTFTLKHYIWSTLPDSDTLSQGKFPVPHFQGKVQIDAVVKADEALYAKTTFMWVGPYAQNFAGPWFKPGLLETSGKYIQFGPAPANTPVQTIGDISANVGQFTSAILAQPALTQRRYVRATVEDTTVGELVQSWGAVTKKDALYVQLASIEQYDAIWPVWGKELGLMMMFWHVAREKSWTKEGEAVLTMKDLGLREELLVDSKAAFEKMAWE